MGDFIAGGLAIMCGLVALMFLAMLCQDLGHIKQKKAKMELLKQHPEHAGQILQSIEDQEARYRSSVKARSEAFQPAPKAAKSGVGMGKLVVVALCAIYIISPLDFIPDVIPVLGWGDDLAAGLIGLRTLLK